MITRLFSALLLLLGLLLPLRAQGVNENRQHFDHNWKTCDETISSFYRVVTSENDTAWLIADYYRFAGTQMSGMARQRDGTGRFGTWRWYHPNRQKSELRTYVEDIQQGTATEWHANGQRADSTFYRNGIIEGTALEWHSNGRLADSTFYRGGKISGISMEWHSNGQVRGRASYDNGQPVGIHRKWYDNGVLEAESRDRSNGAPLTWTWYDKTGRMTAVETYENGKIIDPEYYEPDGSTHHDTVRARSYGEGQSDNAVSRPSTGIMYPQIERSNNIEGTVVLRFQVLEDGSVADIEIRVPATHAMNAEAVRAVQIPGLYRPQKLHNKSRSVYVTMPIHFRLSGD